MLPRLALGRKTAELMLASGAVRGCRQAGSPVGSPARPWALAPVEIWPPSEERQLGKQTVMGHSGNSD